MWTYKSKGQPYNYNTILNFMTDLESLYLFYLNYMVN